MRLISCWPILTNHKANSTLFLGLALPNRQWLARALLLILLTGASVTGAHAADPSLTPLTVPVRGGIHDSFNRVVFDFKQPADYKIDVQPGLVTLSLSRGVQLQKDRLANRLTRLQIDATAGSTGQVRLQVAPDASVKHFMSGNSLVIDVRGAPVLLQPAASNNSVAAVPQEKTPPNLEPKPEGKPEVKSEPVAVTAPFAAPVPAAVPAAAPVTAVMPAPLIPAAPLAAPELPAIPVDETPRLLQQFNPRINVPAAIYARGDFLYVVFDRRLRFDLAQLFDATQPTKVEALPVAGFSAYKLPLPPTAVPLVRKEETKWQIDVVRAPDALSAASEAGAAAVAPSSTVTAAEGLRLRAEPDFSLGARVVIPVRGAGQVLSLLDPAIGDALLLVPTTNVTDHMQRALRYADFEVLPSLQGVVIRPLHDALSVRLVEEGIEISAPQGLRLAPARQANADAQAPTLRAAREDVIPLRRWQQPELGRFTDGRQALQLRVIEAIPALRDRARLELARYFVGHGYGVEARGLLAIVAEQNPDLVTRPEFQLLQGVAHVLARDAAAGLKALEATGLSDRDDVRLWRAVALAQQGQFNEASADFAATLLLLETYPEPFFNRFARLAAESFMAAEDDKNAERVLDEMIKRGGTAAANNPAVLYLRGAVQARSGSLEIARKLWQQAAAGTDYLARTRSELALVDLDVAAGTLPVAEAVRRLEGLRFAWRGDALELELLMRLAEYQLKLEKPLDALETYQRAKTIFPNSPQATKMAEAQQKIFQDIFLGTGNTRFTPLQLLGMYDRFKDTLPPEAPTTQQIVDRVVSEMLAVDLLPQAITLLRERAASVPDAALRLSTNLRLAAVLLLNQQPTEAQQVLQALDAAALSPEQAQERKLMLARAASDLGQFDVAFGLLADDSSVDAQRLLATSAWRAKDWPRAAAALGNVVPTPADNTSPSTPLSPADGQLVLARAVALALANDRAGLANIANSFGGLMANVPQGQAFALLTRADLTTGAGTLARVREQVANVDLFQGFLENYRKGAGQP